MTCLRYFKASARASIALAVLLLAVLVVGSASGTGRYTDAVGDNGAAPDITGATVNNLGGELTFRLTIAGFSLSSAADVHLFVDSDADPSTGDRKAAGADYVFVVEEPANTYSFARWNGSAWEDAPRATVRVLLYGDGVAFFINQSELGNTQQVNIWARTLVGKGGDGNEDVAPNYGLWNYDLRADGPDIRAVLVTAVPPKAGKSFTLKVVGLRLPPDGELVSLIPAPDAYRCTAKLAGRVLKGRSTGGCTFTVPKTARGKQLTVAVTVEYQGAKKTIAFPFRVS